MPPLIYEKKGSIAYLTLNRPEAHNAIDPEMILELAGAWEDYREDSALRCAILTGSGEKTFCSGADLAKLIPLFTGAKKPETDADKRILADSTLAWKALLRDVELSKPIIAAVNGDAIAGGFEFLYATDIRVASQQARFGLQEVKWSIFPAGGSSVWLPRQMPYARAMEMLLTGELISAAEAYEYGFLNRIVSPLRVMEEAEKLAKIIVKNGPVAVSAVKKAVLSNVGRTLSKGLANEMEYALPVFLSEDAKEGPRAFKEKREPQFKGK